MDLRSLKVAWCWRVEGSKALKVETESLEWADKRQQYLRCLTKQLGNVGIVTVPQKAAFEPDISSMDRMGVFHVKKNVPVKSQKSHTVGLGQKLISEKLDKKTSEIACQTKEFWSYLKK